MAKAPPKAATHKVGDYGLNTKFPGYRAREDATELDPQTMITPSQNVLIGTSGRPALTAGYVLDGPGSVVIDSGILSNFDFINFKGDIRNMRAGFLSAAGNDGKLQYRYNNNGVITWQTLVTGLTNVVLSYCTFWDTTNLVKLLLWVDGSNNIFAWNGAVGILASATSTTLTLTGGGTWAQQGFTQTGTPSITINGVTATYSGGATTDTLTGVSVDFSATPAGAFVQQTPVTTALSSVSGVLSTFGPTVIGCGRRNQVYLGASNSNNLYISKVNNYLDYTFTTPTRVVGEGALIPLDSTPTAFIPLESRTDTNAYDMYISEGLDTWAIIRATLSSDLTKETLEHIRMNVSPLQGAISQRLVAKMKNKIMFISHDHVANFLGWISYQYVPAVVDFSFPIINDMNAYDFTNGSMFYYRNYVLITIPSAGIIRLYNMTNQTQQYSTYSRDEEDVTQQPWFWEAPLTFPLSGFYVADDGNLYGHSFTTSESYKLFEGGSLNGQDIDANATFAWDGKGDRTQSKGSNELWVEGYISQNTILNASVTGDLDNFATTQNVTVVGSNSTIVAFGAGAHSLGKNNLGSQPLGGSTTIAGALPAWFHVAKTYVQVSCYLEQISFSTKGVDLAWELICFGTNAVMTNEGNNSITQ